MIVTKITGGLGNQMFQYAIAKSIALNNNNIFKSDISFYKRVDNLKYIIFSDNISWAKRNFNFFCQIKSL